MAIFIRKIVRNSQNWWFCQQKSSKFEENSKINNYSLVPQIEHPVAQCAGQQTNFLRKTKVTSLGQLLSQNSVLWFYTMHNSKTSAWENKLLNWILANDSVKIVNAFNDSTLLKSLCNVSIFKGKCQSTNFWQNFFENFLLLFPIFEMFFKGRWYLEIE